MLDMLFLVCAVVGGTIVVLQFVTTLMGIGDDGVDFDADVDADVGFDADADFDADVDADHTTTIREAADADVEHVGSTWLFKMLSLRSILAAFAFFGLGGLVARSANVAWAPSLLIAGLTGFAAMYAVYWLMQQLYKLRASGTVNIRNAQGRAATIYVPVPPENGGRGKIQMTLQGRTMEYEAVTDEAEKLATGEHVVVVEVLGAELVRVARVEESAPIA